MSERKINLEEILLQNHFHILDTLKNVYSPDTYTENMYERLINGINDICKQLLELAAENADVKAISEMISISNGADFNIQKMVVDKQSIIDTINQVE